MWVYVFADDVYTWGNKKCSNIGKKTNNIGKITIFCRKTLQIPLINVGIFEESLRRLL